jgi:uncharacterized protein (DUF58 family)
MTLLQKLFKSWLSYFSRRPVTPTKTVVLNRHQIFILPTRVGFWFALMLLVMLVGSMNYHNNMGYMLTFLLGSLAIVSMLHTQRNLLGLHITVGKVKPLFAGETAQFELWLDNREQSARYSLMWQSRFSWRIGSNCQTDDLELTIDVPANQPVSLVIPILSTKRGQLFLGPITVYSCFPVGLFYAWASIHLDIATIVYPKPLGKRQLPRDNTPQNQESGYFCEGNGEDFIGYRDYQLGDSPRHIDWKAVARGQDWLIKQFGGTGTTILWLSWDDLNLLDDLEARLSQLCLWILIADSHNIQYGLKMPHCTVEPHSGLQHREHCLQILALYALP